MRELRHIVYAVRSVRSVSLLPKLRLPGSIGAGPQTIWLSRRLQQPSRVRLLGLSRRRARQTPNRRRRVPCVRFHSTVRARPRVETSVPTARRVENHSSTVNTGAWEASDQFYTSRSSTSRARAMMKANRMAGSLPMRSAIAASASAISVRSTRNIRRRLGSRVVS